MHLAFTKNSNVRELVNEVYDIIPDPIFQDGRFIEDFKYTENIINVIRDDVRSFIRQEPLTRDFPEHIRRNFILALSGGNSNISQILTLWVGLLLTRMIRIVKKTAQ